MSSSVERRLEVCSNGKDEDTHYRVVSEVVHIFVHSDAWLPCYNINRELGSCNDH